MELIGSNRIYLYYGLAPSFRFKVPVLKFVCQFKVGIFNVHFHSFAKYIFFFFFFSPLVSISVSLIFSQDIHRCMEEWRQGLGLGENTRRAMVFSE